ncbi:hypothetical protein QKU48_gp1396 [Fadolivirus algeromassiliense]|jgi:hypothetical protein|uniref:Uncharacterized protein n=1 Tax=Fadolivirus FV1/VV64 TaxID=3070911 RepID=A0A7D3UWG2_9VIRU|nr:hypothetical protein QKU48_gp1396 [Fadolivirus algeromassiliense]QKF94854.1 hypothetical protein Fadolivirus_1_1396 [Fadolivirus FV1/VV64]
MQYFDYLKNYVWNINIPNITDYYTNTIETIKDVKNVDYGRFYPNVTHIYESITDNTIINTIKEINYTNYIPDISERASTIVNRVNEIDYTVLYNNSVVNGVKNIDITETVYKYNPINYPLMLFYMIVNQIGFHMCRISVLLLLSLWISVFTMRFVLVKSINFYNLTLVIFLNLMFMVYYPAQCFQ